MREMKRVVITGMGALCPVGNNVADAWAALLAGESGLGPITLFDCADIPTQIAGEVKNFDAQELFGRKEARRMDRVTQLAMAAAQEAIDDARLLVNGVDRERVGTLIGTGIGGMSTTLEQHDVFKNKGARRVNPFFIPMLLPDTPAGRVSIEYGLKGPNFSIVSACATGSHAIGEAFETVARGAADAVITGGAEASIIPLAIAGFNAMGALATHFNDNATAGSRPFDAERDGFVPSEGAAILILESLEHAQQRGAHIYAELCGYGATADAFHISAPLEDGDGAVRAMLAALERADLTIDDVDYINAHGTSTPLNDKTETTAIKNALGERAYEIPISSTKSMVGHMLGAAGALEAIVCAKTLTEGIMHPTTNYEMPDPECDLDYVPNAARQADVQVILSNSFGFGGHNACLAFRRYEEG